VRVNVNALTQVSRSAMPRGEGVEGSEREEALAIESDLFGRNMAQVAFFQALSSILRADVLRFAESAIATITFLQNGSVRGCFQALSRITVSPAALNAPISILLG